MPSDVDIAALDYPTVRAAFNATLNLCVDKLSRADLALAQDILGVAASDESIPGVADMLADAALYSAKDMAGARTIPRRAIDRIAPKLPVKRDPLKAAIAARLPSAIFSIFAAEGAHEEGGVIARDLLDDGRTIHIMDRALATQVTTQEEFLFAGRFLDLGPWYIGFGIVLRLRKSEAVAIRLALSGGEDAEIARESLHELIYPSHLHGGDLVMAALEPLITTFAQAIDADMLDMGDLAASLGALFTDKPTPSRKGKTLPARR